MQRGPPIWAALVLNVCGCSRRLFPGLGFRILAQLLRGEEGRGGAEGRDAEQVVALVVGAGTGCRKRRHRGIRGGSRRGWLRRMRRVAALARAGDVVAATGALRA